MRQISVPWYVSWFGDDYLCAYAYRNDEEAREQIRFLMSAGMGPTEGKYVVDIACGYGRHSRALNASGAKVLGIDRSLPALERAATEPKNGIRYVLGDMRHLPCKDQMFDIAISMFTSFGYFETDRDHHQVTKEWRRILKNSGKFVLDYLNRQQVIENFTPSSEEVRNGRKLIIQKALSPDQTRVEKKITIEDLQTGEQRHFSESVRMFTREEIHLFLKDAHFHVIGEWGDFDGSSWSSQSSRLIVLAEARS